MEQKQKQNEPKSRKEGEKKKVVGVVNQTCIRLRYELATIKQAGEHLKYFSNLKQKSSIEIGGLSHQIRKGFSIPGVESFSFCAQNETTSLARETLSCSG
jgi:hypothetical protein